MRCRGAIQREVLQALEQRKGSVSRGTSETRVSVSVDLDGTGEYRIETGCGMFDHLLAQISRHGLIDLDVAAEGDSHVGWHHLVEDTAISLGRVLRDALGDARGITRTAHAFVPLDETLAFAAVDLGGRGYAVIDVDIGEADLGGLSGSLIGHFLESFAHEGKFNLHVRLLYGANNHHKAEAVFKALARALRAASERDPRRAGGIPSTKDVIG